MAGFEDAALCVVHQDDEPSTTKTIDAGDPEGGYSPIPFLSFSSRPSFLS